MIAALAAGYQAILGRSNAENNIATIDRRLISSGDHFGRPDFKGDAKNEIALNVMQVRRETYQAQDEASKKQVAADLKLNRLA